MEERKFIKLKNKGRKIQKLKKLNETKHKRRNKLLKVTII